MSTTAPAFKPITITLEETAFPHTRFADEFQAMAMQIHCHHTGRSFTWDKNEEDWKNCQYTFCRRRYELFISMTDAPSVLVDDLRPRKPSEKFDDNPAPTFGDDSDK